MPVLVAPAALSGELRAPVVAAAIGRGLERAGLRLPELCPVAGGGPGTLEVLLPALGGATASARVLDAAGREFVAGFGLVDGGGTAIVEAAQLPDAVALGGVVAAAIDSGAAVVVVACGGSANGDGSAAEAVERCGGLRGAALVALYDERPVAGLAHDLVAGLGAQLVSGAAFVLEELGFDARMRAARAVVVGEARLDRATLGGRVAGEIAIRARQAGIPCHAVVMRNAIERFDARILDVQGIVEASTVAELEAAGERLALFL